MSWLLNLYQTYEANLDRVGVIELNRYEREYTLLPVSHTTQNAHISVEITEDGNFHSAEVLQKENTLIPCTEKSASRAGSVVAPYPLHDKLSYVAGDYVAYGGQVKKEIPFDAYIKQLKEWAESPHSCAKVRSIYTYLSKGRLIEDLVKEGILFADQDNKLIDKWDKKYESATQQKPELFSVLAGEQTSALVRFNVYSPTVALTPVWKDQEVYDSFIRHYSGLLGEEDYCFVTGERKPSTDKHANKIRHSGDKAKLISANDNSGFTYRGRFVESTDAASISYEVSQKAHNALKWLIQRQGKVIDERVFLIWANKNTLLPDVGEDTFSFHRTKTAPQKLISFTNEEQARELAKALDGYSNKLSPESKSQVNIMILDSATTGRMAVLYYRNMDKHLYFQKIIKWHSTCVWLHRYRKNEEGEMTVFFGAPATKDIAFAAYGPTANDKVVKGLMERMLPCIIDERRIPHDIVRSAIYRASNPVSMERWEWEKTLSITCALINKEEGMKVALDKETNDRNYLFGRLLAIADVMERSALDSEEKRSTNAVRYMNSFSKYPARTWQTIQSYLQPHQARLGTKLTYYSRMIDEVASRMAPEDFTNAPLSGKYLLGFYSQRHELYQKKDKEPVKTDTTSSDEPQA